MTELTEAEIERLWSALDDEPRDPAALVDAVADLIDARNRDLRDYRAAYTACVDLAEEWDVDNRPTMTGDCATALLAALSADLTAPQPTSGTEGQDEDVLRSCGCCDGSDS